MKKLISLILVMGMALSLVGCAGEAPVEDEIKQGSVILPAEEPSQGEDGSSENGEFPSATQDPPQTPSGGESGSTPQKPATEGNNSSEQKPSTNPSKPEPETPAEKPDTSTPGNSGATTPQGEFRAVWLSYLELGGMLTGKTETQFRSNISSAFSAIAAQGMNTVIIHVRPFGDALYNSSIFPTSYLITGTEGDPLPFDPLSIMVTEAHKQGLSLEAWINPYRVRVNATKPIAASNPAQSFLNAGSNAVYRYNNGIYYNPGSSEAVDLIVAGIEEIVSNYDVDGIHFDDYFYATTDSSIDSSLYAAYQSGGGTLSLDNWRRANVNSMVKKVYSAIKAIDSTVRFGISPQGNMTINYSTLYADVATWLASSGYLDYICPQIYYGFDHATYAYDTVLSQFNSMIKVSSIDLYVGLAAYKIGTVDSYAGASGKNEWVNRSDMLSRMVASARGASHYKGFVIYSYSSILTPASSVKSQVAAELSALFAIL